MCVCVCALSTHLHAPAMWYTGEVEVQVSSRVIVQVVQNGSVLDVFIRM